MAEDTTYNGWANRETWLVALWINNDQGWQESVHDAILEGNRHNVDADLNAADLLAWEAGDIVKDNVEEMTYGEDAALVAGLAADLLGTALAAVDWTEIGASFLTSALEVSA